MASRNSGKARSQQTKGVAESVLRTRPKLDHRGMDPQSLLAKEVVLQRLENGLCPYCDRGPFQQVVTHTSRAHGMGPREIRDAAGVSYEYVLTSPDLHASNVARGKRRDMAKIRENRDPKRKRVLSDAAQLLNRQKLEVARESIGPSELARRAGAAMAERYAGARQDLAPQITQMVKQGASYEQIANEMGVGLTVVKHAARESGVAELRTALIKQVRVERLGEFRNQAVASNIARLEADRAKTLQAWSATDGEWTDLVALAESTGRSPKQMRHFLVRAGATVPDGRKSPDRKPRPPRTPKPKQPCSQCDRPSHCRGMCSMHYQRAFKAGELEV